MVYQKITTYIIIGLSLFLLFSCDPSQIIRIENTTDAEANIEFTFKEGKRHYRFEDQIKDNQLKITLAPDAQNSMREFHFRMGHWRVQNSLDSLVGMIESIEITTKNSTQTFSGKQQLHTFFEERITGSQDEIILIDLK